MSKEFIDSKYFSEKICLCHKRRTKGRTSSEKVSRMFWEQSEYKNVQMQLFYKYIHVFKYTRELMDTIQSLQNNYWQAWVVLHSLIRAFQHALLAFQWHWKCFECDRDEGRRICRFYFSANLLQGRLLFLMREATYFRCNQNMFRDWMTLWKQRTCSCNQLITFPFPQLKVWKPPLLLRSTPWLQLA